MKKPLQTRIDELNKGQVEAMNLMEALVIDFPTLLSNTMPDVKTLPLPEKCGITHKMRLIAVDIYNQKGLDAFSFMAEHPSDTLRGLSCYLLAQSPLNLIEKLGLIAPLADDSNSGVREWAWIALRPALIQNLEIGLTFLEGWVHHPSPRKRRYASEMTRPRGVWCSHITQLRQTPWLALNILTHLNQDKERYVQLSVGNWLNDAGKDHPLWVKNLCEEWQNITPTPETFKICKRALRNLQ